MRNVTEYPNLTDEQLKVELTEITSVLSTQYTDLGTMMANQHRDFLHDYIASPGGSVAAKNREAQYNNMETTVEIINTRSAINSLILCRDLLAFFLTGQVPGSVPFPQIATYDSEGLAS